ncbi:MAG: CoA transferase [Raoultibacter sp.]
MAKPLDGIKVVDLTTYLAAPTSGRVLAEWGADVVKVESAKADPTRTTQAAVYGMPMSDEENLAFDMANVEKRFVSLNLKDEMGMEVMMKLLSEADIFLTNNRTKSLAKMGLDYETLHAKFPRLIFAHVLGYGKAGAEKDAAGFDVTCYMARGGVFGTTVNKGDAPMVPTNGYGDFQVSMFVVAGILAAMHAREASGAGDYVTCALQHAGIYALSTGMVSAQYGNQYPKSRKEVVNPLNNVFRSKDQKWVCLCLPEYDRDFDKVMTLLGRADMCGNEKYNNCARLNANHLNNAIVDILDEAMGKFTLEELLGIFKANDMPCEPAQEPCDIYEDQNVWDNDYLVKIDYPNGARNIPTSPVQFESMGAPVYTPTGKLGSATVDVMKELGYKDAQIEQALAQGSVKGTTSLECLV